jgi:hypothetical protein
MFAPPMTPAPQNLATRKSSSNLLAVTPLSSRKSTATAAFYRQSIEPQPIQVPVQVQVQVNTLSGRLS